MNKDTTTNTNIMLVTPVYWLITKIITVHKVQIMTLMIKLVSCILFFYFTSLASEDFSTVSHTVAILWVIHQVSHPLYGKQHREVCWHVQNFWELIYNVVCNDEPTCSLKIALSPAICFTVFLRKGMFISTPWYALRMNQWKVRRWKLRIGAFAGILAVEE